MKDQREERTMKMKAGMMKIEEGHPGLTVKIGKG